MVISALSFFFGTSLAPMILKECSNGPADSSGGGSAAAKLASGPKRKTRQRNARRNLPNSGEQVSIHRRRRRGAGGRLWLVNMPRFAVPSGVVESRQAAAGAAITFKL